MGSYNVEHYKHYLLNISMLTLSASLFVVLGRTKKVPKRKKCVELLNKYKLKEGKLPVHKHSAQNKALNYLPGARGVSELAVQTLKKTYVTANNSDFLCFPI